MTTYMKTFIDYYFYGDILAFRCHCLTHHVEPRMVGFRGRPTPYGFCRVSMAKRKNLAKRLILMSR